MAGTEYSGPSAAMSGLFENKTVVICDKELSGEEHIQKATQIFLDMKMKIIEMDSKTHDMHAAYISHLPHIISYSIANTVLDRENPTDILSMAAGGFRDMSRLAKSRPDLWTQIFRQNKANLLESIELFEKNVKELKELIKSNDWNELNAALERAKGLHSIFK
jgi:prephenate dehydrogenase